MIKKTISYIQIKENLSQKHERDLYYKSTNRIVMSEDGGFYLNATESYDFTTYFNNLPVLKWKKYTVINNLCLEIEAKGNFRVNILSYNSYNTTKNIISSNFFDLSKKDTVKIDIPIDIPCDLVAFEIIPLTKTKLYNARYVTEVSKKNIKKPELAMLTSVKDVYNSISNNISVLAPFLTNGNNDAPQFKWFIFDPDSTLEYDYKEISNIHIVRDLEKDGEDYLRKTISYTLNNSVNSTHFILLSDRVSIVPSALTKLYAFLSLLKDEYDEVLISALLFDFFSRNQLITDIGKVDVNITDRLVKSECGIDIGDNNHDWYMSCIPAKLLKKDHHLPFPYYRSGELQVSDIDSKSLYLGGVCCYTKEVSKNYTNSSELYITDWEDFIAFKEGYVLQNILFPNQEEINDMSEMFYRSQNPVKKETNGHITLAQNTFYDFSTYFNSFSYEKWKKYTEIKDVWLELDVVGKFRIELMGHFVNASGDITKEWLGQHEYTVKKRRKISIPIPASCNSSVIAFQIHVFEKNVTIYGGGYSSNVDEKHIRPLHIALATTTFQKESFMEKNIKLLNESLFNDKEYSDSFTWIVVDNGQSLDVGSIENEHIHVFYNKNSGGAGGFTRGIIEANKLAKKPSHILLMDDDVQFMPDSFKRLYKLLSILKPQYENHFISGAMLEMDERNIQHEDIGKTNSFGEHGPVKPRYDLNLWDSVILNEKIIPDDPHQYAGWWYCCIPASTARLDNLPLPVFIRGDDIEYSFRNKAKFITMNGICIWHKGFGNKFSAALEFYQVHRNDLILHSINRHVNDVNIIKRINNLFWEEIYKFNYRGAELLVEAVEDYMKGPEFIKSLNGEKCMKSKKNKDNQLIPITPEIEALIDRETLYTDIPLSAKKKKIYDYSYNGQLIPSVEIHKKAGVIPYGWGYFPGRQYLTTVIYAVDPVNNLYVEYRKNHHLFKQVTSRFTNIMKRYAAEHKEIARAYKKATREITNENFWIKYLK